MADEATQAAENGGKSPEGEGKDTTEDQRVPYQRFEEVNSRAKKAENELAELRARLEEFEDRDKSEVERAQARAQRAESQLADLSGKVTAMEKGAWVRSAAADLNFHDPEDAVQHLRDQLGGLDDQSDAKRLVRNLAKNKKHLIREDKPAERPSIGQIFAGQQAQPGQQQPAAAGGQSLTPQQQAAKRELEFAQGLAGALSQFRDGWHNAGGIA